MMSDESQVAIVTGGAQGLGAAICTVLLEEGYMVCVADIQKEKGSEFVSEKQRKFGRDKIIFSHCDVSVEENVHDTFCRTINAFKKVDVLVNNAGIVKEEYPETTIAVNLLGTVNGCEMAFRFMGKRNGGNGGIVINTAYRAGFIPKADIPLYRASQRGIIGLTRSFGHPFHFELEGIIFAAICPHLVDTELAKDVTVLENIASKSPITRKLLSPEFVAKGVLQILKDQINGSTLLISQETGYKYIELQADLKKVEETLGKMMEK